MAEIAHCYLGRLLYFPGSARLVGALLRAQVVLLERSYEETFVDHGPDRCRGWNMGVCADSRRHLAETGESGPIVSCSFIDGTELRCVPHSV